MYPRWLWPVFAVPGVVWLILLFLIPFYAVIGVAFGSVDPIFQNPIPTWNPFDWQFDAFFETLKGFLPGNTYWSVFIRTTVYVALALTGSLLIGYPVAYYISRHAQRSKSILLALLVLPFWVSYMMRMLAWINLFSPSGYINKILLFTHIVTTPPNWLDGNSVSVVLGLIYGYIPYLILPLLAALDRIDRSVLEAARDLGASPMEAFLHVTLPLSKPAILASMVIVTLPMFGDYYTNNLLSGSPKTTMFGNLLDNSMEATGQGPQAAILVLFLVVFLMIPMLYYMRETAKAQINQ